MNEKELVIDFTKSLIEAPLAIIFFVLDILGIIVVIKWVIDDFQELIVFLIFVIIVNIGQYLIFRRYRLRLANFELAKPCIEFSKVRQAPLIFSSPLGVNLPGYEVLQVWFRNNPQIPLETTIAKNVTALVEIVKSDTSKLFEFHGQWAETNAPDNVGYKNIHDAENIQPGYIEAKLMILLKYPSDSSCYAFTKESVQSSDVGRSPKYEIVPGKYIVIIHLRGVGVDNIFEFDLHNLGTNQTLILNPKSSEHSNNPK
jgi:hypothetical protein